MRDKLQVNDSAQLLFVYQVGSEDVFFVQRDEVDKLLSIANQISVVNIKLHFLGILELRDTFELNDALFIMDMIHETNQVMILNFENLQYVEFSPEQGKVFSIWREGDSDLVCIVNGHLLDDHHSLIALDLDQL